ncbi:POL, partial [Symbiodinium pilosum]
DALGVTERLAVFPDKTPADVRRLAGWLRSPICGLKWAGPPDSIIIVSRPHYHIMESWDVEKMMEEPPTDAYYEALAKDLRDKHKIAWPCLLDHFVSLEAFLDKSILFGFSFGINKAEICVAQGALPGGTRFLPLREKLHIEQFLSCANWLRGYHIAEYGHAAKVLGEWQKPGAIFLSGASEGCKALRAVKKMMQQHICLAAFDEASAADGSCPLEQISDASGTAVGGSVVQMSQDLSKLKVLMRHFKSVTLAQQNWPPVIQEAFAQLEVKR